MRFESEFTPLALGELRKQAAYLKAEGWRFVQTHAVNAEAGVDLYYTFMKEGRAVNYRVEGVTPDDAVPSITDLFLAAFVFENEARELFGVDMRNIALDFQGAMYAPAESSPMTFISPEQKAAREKAKKVAAAKAQAAESGQEGGAPAAGKRVFVMTPELQARLDAKMPSLSDEKKAKVEAALKARAAEAEASSGAAAPAGKPAVEAGTGKANENTQAKPAEATPTVQEPQDEQLEQAIALLDASKADLVRAALGGKPASGDASAGDAPTPAASPDAQVDALLGLMDDAKAAKVAQALASKGGE